MKRRPIAMLAVPAGVSLVVGLILSGCTGLPLVRRPVSVKVQGPLERRTALENLNSPVQIHELHADGLIIADGRVIQLRFVKEIPATNAIFAAATSHGIEIAPDGKVVGLLDVNHWCGNDPIGKHLGRVDLAALAIYLGAGTTEDAPGWLRSISREPFTDFGFGFDPGDYVSVQWIAKAMDME